MERERQREAQMGIDRIEDEMRKAGRRCAHAHSNVDGPTHARPAVPPCPPPNYLFACNRQQGPLPSRCPPPRGSDIAGRKHSPLNRSQAEKENRNKRNKVPCKKKKKKKKKKKIPCKKKKKKKKKKK